MSVKKKVQSGSPEAVPAPEESLVAATPVTETVTGQQAGDALPGEATEIIEEVQNGIPETVPAPEKSLVAATPAAETVTGQQAGDALPREAAKNIEEQEAEQDAPEMKREEPKAAEPGQKLFQITCRNNVSGMIGGVMFVDGVGYTRDAYAASWFANKDGYKVDSE